MTNTCTNIFLEELERFEGILIATTNVAVMLDEAFERRFLYRVELKAPDATSRQRIWNQKFTELPAAWIQTLAALQLTGAQIDNVRRKYISFQVLQDASPEFEMLLNWTKDEAKSVFNRPKAGYVL
jgi:SpoVK/Ycf46/Vps4 family AAA+-type ATPase